MIRGHTAYHVPTGRMAPGVPPPNRLGVLPLIVTWIKLRRMKRSHGGVTRKLVCIMVVALLSAGMTWSAHAGEFENGLDAFNAGDYAKAFAIWWPLARDGDAKSQASVGFLYYSGKGVPRDDRRSLVWFRLAADAGQPTAQYYLGVQYFYGLGVRRDLAQAYSWCDIALTNGYAESLSCRDTAELEMSADDKRRSAELTAEFFRTHDARN